MEFRAALRRLASAPGFALTAVAVLALAIAVTTSIASVTRAVGAAAMPYPAAERLVVLSEARPSAGLDQLMTSHPTALDWAEQLASFEAVAAYNPLGTLVHVDPDGPVRLRANVVTSGYFDVVGAQPALGRLFRPDEDVGWNQHAVAVLSHGAWRRLFGGDPSVVGRAVALSERSYTVVGVLQQGYVDLASSDHPTDLFVPVSMGPHVVGVRTEGALRGSRWLTGVGRLRADVSRPAAEAELVALAERLAEAHPDTNRGHTAKLRPLEEVLVGDVRRSRVALAGAAVFVMLIGCANLGGLLLVRTVGRRRELAVRTALGMGPRALFHQALIEAGILVGVGGALGVALAYAVNARLREWIPVPLPEFVDLRPDVAVLAGSLTLGAAVAALFAGLPVLETRRRDLARALHDDGPRGGAGVARGRLQRATVVVEIAAAAVLMVGGALMGRSYAALHDSAIGFRSDGLITLKMDLESERFASSERLVGFVERLGAAVEALPGVESFSVWGPRMPSQATWYTAVLAHGADADELADATIARRHHVSPGALTKLGVPFRAGRDFTQADRGGQPAVVIVSESTAQALWPGEDPIGQRMVRWRPPDPNEQAVFEVVGVVADVKQTGRRSPADNPRDLYFSYLQVPRRELNVLVRSGVPPEAAVPALRRAVREIEAALPVYDIATMEERLAQDEAPTRFAALLLAAYAALATALAALGIYGVVAYTVRQRRHELGVRVALGATRRRVATLVGREVLGLVALGLGLGLAGGVAASGALRGMLFGVSPTDPATFAAVAVILAAVAVAGALVPALRASRVDPAAVLRDAGRG